MEICNVHDEGEIVFESRNCPACVAVQELEKRISDLEAIIDDQKAEISRLEK